ncbi:MAG TPA: Rrf2 family transcriptional regulator [bacterium]|nr:Rrf2 family transcriptional regulator [bacterium]HPN35007.1 Rrf2 family transcriptional regulator [bacterium]
MKITYKGDYALKAILDLCFRYAGSEIVPINDIAQRQNIPVKYLEQIMLVLKGAGLVESKRGLGGGFRLRLAPDQITVGRVLRLLEGPIEPISCSRRHHDGSCGEEECCAFREIWLKVTDAITEIVDQVTFSHLMQRTLQLQKRKTHR